MNQTTRIGLAVQKSGRLARESEELLEQCGIDLVKSKDQLFCTANNFAMDVYFVRDDDIPAFVASGVCQIGIVGQNVLLEDADSDDGLETVSELGFGGCRLSIAAPHDMAYDGPASLNGKSIATSYPHLLGRFAEKHGIDCSIVTMKGAVEIAPRIEMADCICDLVSTGSTLAMNGLSEIETILHSQAVLVRGTRLSDDQQALIDRFLARLDGVRQARTSKYIMLHCPRSALDEVRGVLPGAETPTILDLQGREDMVAVHAVCNEGVFWDTMERLKACGASSILVLPIEKLLA